MVTKYRWIGAPYLSNMYYKYLAKSPVYDRLQIYKIYSIKNPGEMASILTQTTPFILLATNMENQWPDLSGGSIVMVGDDDYFLDFGYNDTDEISM